MKPMQNQRSMKQTLLNTSSKSASCEVAPNTWVAVKEVNLTSHNGYIYICINLHGFPKMETTTMGYIGLYKVIYIQ